jgi:hypothetical protein
MVVDMEERPASSMPTRVLSMMPTTSTGAAGRFPLAPAAAVDVAPDAMLAPSQQFAAPILQAGKRWQASAWIVARGSGAAGAAPVSQLGGGQAGIRVDRTIGGGFAITGRLTTALAAREQEAALGFAWQPRGSSLRIVAEHRFALHGARGGPALGVSVGVSDLRLPAGVRLEAYGQAGVIGRDGIEGYADGAARAFAPAAQLGKVTLELGLGAWGAKQRGAERLDIGPGVSVRLPFRDGGARLQLDWRQRVAGRAQPDSGPALTLASDF